MGAAMNVPEPTVIRTWKRDGTTNAMSLDEAAENLARNGYDVEGPPDERRASARRALLAGATLRTALATFALEG
jgi:hypothetical protein